MLGRRITELRSEYTYSALERLGLLPNYTLTDETIRLDAVLWGIDGDSEKFRNESSFDRPAEFALSEFAPGNTYYAKGHRYLIDALDIGTPTEPILESWRLCPDCGYGALDVAQTTWVRCPRCARVGIADLGARHQLLRVRRVMCIDSEEQARVFDETDERERERFARVTTVDVDPAKVEKPFKHLHVTFGSELARETRNRFLNFGSVERPGATIKVSGLEVPHHGSRRVAIAAS